MIRADIQTQIANYLNRPGDPNITGVVDLWFGIAHNAIQRLRNWKAQETTGMEQIFVGQSKYCAPQDIKEGFSLYTYDGNLDQMIGNYKQVDIATLRAMRLGFIPPNVVIVNPLLTLDDLTNPRLFAIWAEDLEIYPTPGDELNGKELRWDYYRWLDPPGLDCSDWFTVHGGDYILYRALTEAVPFLDSTDNRLQVWSAMMNAARNELLGVDVSATWASASLQMRG